MLEAMRQIMRKGNRRTEIGGLDRKIRWESNERRKEGGLEKNVSNIRSAITTWAHSVDLILQPGLL